MRPGIARNPACAFFLIQHANNSTSAISASLSGRFSLDGVSPLDVNSFDGVAGTVINAVDGSNVASSTSTDVDIAPAVKNTATDGTYQFEAGPFGISNNGDDFSSFQYGLTTVGGGLGSFSGAALNAGNGQDDFGIVAFDVSLTANVAGTLPLIDTSAMFFWDRPNDFTSLSQIDPVVRISRGSLPDGFLQTPEPSSLSLVWIALLISSINRQTLRFRRRTEGGLTNKGRTRTA